VGIIKRTILTYFSLGFSKVLILTLFLTTYLENEGLMWVEAQQVTKQALSNRLRNLPAELFAQMFEQVVKRQNQQAAHVAVPEAWSTVNSRFACVWLADGSTLEGLVKKYRSNPCQHRVRLVSVLWGQTWHTYLTNVLDPTELSPQQVCDLYCRRWRIEDAFLLTKRLLGLAYLWVGGSNGIQIQLYATWIFSAVLMDLCSQVAVALRQQERTHFCRDGVS
jgi:Transposase DDE domain